MTLNELAAAFKLFNDQRCRITCTGYSVLDCAQMRGRILTAIETLQQIIAKVGDVEDIVGQRGVPCPVQSQTVVSYIRHALGIPACNTAKAEKKTVRAKQTHPYLDDRDGPFTAEIVLAADMCKAIWRSKETYDTVDEAAKAIISRAKRLRHRITGITNNWMTLGGWQVVDYGSYTYYGKIAIAGSKK